MAVCMSSGAVAHHSLPRRDAGYSVADHSSADTHPIQDEQAYLMLRRWYLATLLSSTAYMNWYACERLDRRSTSSTPAPLAADRADQAGIGASARGVDLEPSRVAWVRCKGGADHLNEVVPICEPDSRPTSAPRGR